MIELDACRELWREQPERPPERLTEERLMRMIEAKMADIRGQAIQRVRQESHVYIAIAVMIAAINIAGSGMTLKSLLSTLAAAALLGVIVTALYRKEHRMRTQSLASSLQDSLAAMITALDSTSRAYLVAYMFSIVVGTGVAEVVLLRTHGLTTLTILSLFIAAGFLAWSYTSGRAYSRRIFQPYRSELQRCLQELRAG